MTLARLACALGVSCVLSMAALALVPVGASLVLDDPMPAWAGGVDEAVADEGSGSSSDADATASSSGNAAVSANANGATTQTAASSSSSVTAASSSASQSSGSSSRASGAGDSSADRGYVGPWYALNDNYVVQIEERFDSITEDEYMTTVSRMALIAVAVAAVVLAVVMFVRAQIVQSKAKKRRR